MKDDIFENEEYKIKNGELTEYLVDKKKVIINANIEGHAVTTIGTGAFGNKKIDTLILQEGIKGISDLAFYRSNIKSLILPTTLTTVGSDFFRNNIPENIVVSRKMSKFKWNGLRKKCIPIVGGKLLLTNQHTGDKVLDAIIENYSIKNLFRSELEENMMTLFAVGKDREDIVFDSKRIKSKDFLVGYLIRCGIFLSVNENVDCSDDYNYRSYINHQAKDVVLCKLSVEDEGGSFDSVVIKAHFVKGTYYWMRIEKIIYKGKTFYISSREFLNPNDKIPYLKKVENVYDATEREVQGKDKEMVLKKYNLLRSIP